jgi:hypothetical protein
MADALSVAPALPLAAPVKSVVAAPKSVERPTATDAAARPAVVSAQKAQPVPESRIDKQVHLPSAAERAETEYRRGVLAQRQGDAERCGRQLPRGTGDNMPNMPQPDRRWRHC